MNKKKVGTAAAGGSGIAVILTWIVQEIAAALALIHIDLPTTVQAAIVGLILAPIINWLTSEGFVVNTPRAEKPMVHEAPHYVLKS